MNPNQRKLAAITALAELFGRQLTRPALLMYLRAIEDVPADAIERAATKAAQSSKFMPTPGELRELAGIPNAADRALLAWGAVERAVVRFGSYRSVSFDDPLINGAIRLLGGWAALCGRPAADFDKWGRRDFIATYESLERTGADDDLCAPLPGLGQDGDVRRVDGMMHALRVGVAKVRTGLPWATERKRIDDQTRPAQVPRLALQTPYDTTPVGTSGTL